MIFPDDRAFSNESAWFVFDDVFAVHLLGQPAKINEIKEFCKEKNLILVEDCCESMGAKVGGIKIGNFGLMGSFSFYFGLKFCLTL